MLEQIVPGGRMEPVSQTKPPSALTQPNVVGPAGTAPLGQLAPQGRLEVAQVVPQHCPGPPSKAQLAFDPSQVVGKQPTGVSTKPVPV
jgi:hypothetical protein